MTARAQWRLWEDRIAQAAATEASLRSSLLAVAAEIRTALPADGRLGTQWRALDVEVVRARLGASGASALTRGRRLVFVEASEPSARQRFTAAHEVAHLLLQQHSRAEEQLARTALERLCDEFASAVLIGPGALLDALAERGIPRTPLELLQLCARFRVNVQPMLLALRPRLAREPVLLLASRRRGHPDRPWEIDFRVDAAASHGRLFVPPHQRLRSLGFERLTEWAQLAPLHARYAYDDLVQLPPRRVAEPVWPGEVSWEARLHGLEPRLVLAAVDVSALVSAPTVPTALAV